MEAGKDSGEMMKINTELKDRFQIDLSTEFSKISHAPYISKAERPEAKSAEPGKQESKAPPQTVTGGKSMQSENVKPPSVVQFNAATPGKDQELVDVSVDRMCKALPEPKDKEKFEQDVAKNMEALSKRRPMEIPAARLEPQEGEQLQDAGKWSKMVEQKAMDPEASLGDVAVLGTSQAAQLEAMRRLGIQRTPMLVPRQQMNSFLMGADGYSMPRDAGRNLVLTKPSLSDPDGRNFRQMMGMGMESEGMEIAEV
jgi:hypothetical protein